MYKVVAFLSFFLLTTTSFAQSQDKVRFIGKNFINNQICEIEFITSNDSVRINIRSELLFHSFKSVIRDFAGYDVYFDLLWNMKPLVTKGHISNQVFTGSLLYNGIEHQLMCHQANKIDDQLYQLVQGYYRKNGQSPISIFKYFDRIRVHNPYTGATHLYKSL